MRCRGCSTFLLMAMTPFADMYIPAGKPMRSQDAKRSILVFGRQAKTCLKWMHTHLAMAPYGMQAPICSKGSDALLAGAAPELPQRHMAADLPHRLLRFVASGVNQHLLTIQEQIGTLKTALPSYGVTDN